MDGLGFAPFINGKSKATDRSERHRHGNKSWVHSKPTRTTWYAGAAVTQLPCYRRITRRPAPGPAACLARR